MERLSEDRSQMLAFWSSLFVDERHPLDVDAKKKGGAPLNKYLRELVDGSGNSMSVRRFHDSLGWCAARPKKQWQNGMICRGAIYRTAAFMDIPISARTGTATNGNPVNIHIEHTVGAKQFFDEVWPKRKSGDQEAIRFLVGLIPTTAMTLTERRSLGRHEPNQCFNPASESFDRPFRRYRDHDLSPVVNLVTERLVDIETYSFRDHMRSIQILLNDAGAGNRFNAETFSARSLSDDLGLGQKSE